MKMSPSNDYYVSLVCVCALGHARASASQQTNRAPVTHLQYFPLSAKNTHMKANHTKYRQHEWHRTSDQMTCIASRRNTRHSTYKIDYCNKFFQARLSNNYCAHEMTYLYVPFDSIITCTQTKRDESHRIALHWCKRCDCDVIDMQAIMKINEREHAWFR